MITNLESYKKLNSHDKLSCLKEIKDVKLLKSILAEVKRKVLVNRITAILKRLGKISPGKKLLQTPLAKKVSVGTKQAPKLSKEI